MTCDECINEYRIRALEDDRERNQETHKEFFDKFEKVNLQIMAHQKDMSYITSTLEEIGRDVKEIKEKPVKRYDAAVGCIITTIIGAVLGFILSGVF